MTTASGHTSAILASRVKGATVYNTGGAKIGHVEDIILDKQSDRIMFAALGFGGVLGLGEKYAPVPWSLLTYSKDMGGYVLPMSADQIKARPGYDLNDLVRGGSAFAAHSSQAQGQTERAAGSGTMPDQGSSQPGQSPTSGGAVPPGQRD